MDQKKCLLQRKVITFGFEKAYIKNHLQLHKTASGNTLKIHFVVKRKDETLFT